MKNSQAIKSSVAERLRELRKNAGLSQEQLADILSEALPDLKTPITKTSISLWENGRQTPRLDKLEAYHSVFDCTMDYLTGKSTNKYLTEEQDKNSLAQLRYFHTKNKRRAAFVIFAESLDIGFSYRKGNDNLITISCNTLPDCGEPRSYEEITCTDREIAALATSAKRAVENILSSFIEAKINCVHNSSQNNKPEFRF